MKTKNLFFTMIIILCVAFLFAGCQDNIEENPTSSTTGKEGPVYSGTELLTFELNDDGESYKVVEVNGECPTNIVIPAEYNGLPVTVIGRRAFAEEKNLESVVLPNTIIEIGIWAFDTCTALKEISIPDSVVVISGSAFSYCTSLTEIIIPDSVKELDSGAFYRCSSLEKVSLGKNIKIIGESTFSECVALREIDLPQNLEEIREQAFMRCESLLLSELPSSLRKIGQAAFLGCSSIMCLTLPEGLETIEVGAFNGCYSMFEICNKSNIDIEVGKNANNYGASYLKRVITDISQSNFRIDGDFIIYDDGEEIIVTKYIGNSEEPVFPEYTDGRKYTVYGRVIPIDNQVKSIMLSKSIERIDGFAFQNCLHLETLIIDCEGASIDTNAFGRIDYPVTGVMHSVKNIYINAQTSLDEQGFYRQFGRVENIVFGECITTIPKYFVQCHTLKSVELSSTIEEIGEGAFYGCRGLATIIIPGDIKITEIKDKTFQDCNIESFIVPKNVTRIGKNAFSYTPLQEINLPEKLTVIDEMAFAQCPNLKYIKVPDNVEIIGMSAFWSCSKLTKVEISDNSSLHTIGASAFSNCTYLSDIFLPKTVAIIEPFAFAGCKHLTEFVMDANNPYYLVHDKNIYTRDFTVFVCKAPGYGTCTTIPASVKEIGEGAFCTAPITRLDFEEGSNLEIIGEKAFYGCRIETITIPKSVKVIKEGAFSECQWLKNVYFEDGMCLERIEGRAFYGASQYDNVTIPKSVQYIGVSVYYNVDEVYYEGTVEQWETIVKESAWIYSSFDIRIYCSDQTIIIDR